MGEMNEFGGAVVEVFASRYCQRAKAAGEGGGRGVGTGEELAGGVELSMDLEAAGDLPLAIGGEGGLCRDSVLERELLGFLEFGTVGGCRGQARADKAAGSGLAAERGKRPWARGEQSSRGHHFFGGGMTLRCAQAESVNRHHVSIITLTLGFLRFSMSSSEHVAKSEW